MNPNVTCGGPPVDWKARHDEMLKHISALGAAASVLKDQHRVSAQCEHPRTCGGCHFWSGVIEACRDLETGDKSTIRKALAIVNSEVNPPEHSNNETYD